VDNANVSTLPEFSAFQSQRVVFKDQLRNCEHVVFDEKNAVAYLSCDPGRDRWNAVVVSLKGGGLVG
jgi:arylesterase / paraoxonase